MIKLVAKMAKKLYETVKEMENLTLNYDDDVL